MGRASRDPAERQERSGAAVRASCPSPNGALSSQGDTHAARDFRAIGVRSAPCATARAMDGLLRSPAAQPPALRGTPDPLKARFAGLSRSERRGGVRTLEAPNRRLTVFETAAGGAFSLQIGRCAPAARPYPRQSTTGTSEIEVRPSRAGTAVIGDSLRSGRLSTAGHWHLIAEAPSPLGAGPR
jgi:hypothetical protein